MRTQIFRKLLPAFLAGMMVTGMAVEVVHADEPDTKDATSGSEEATAAPTPTPLAKDAKIVEINGKELTVEEFTMMANFRPLPMQYPDYTNSVPTMRGEDLSKLAHWVGGYDIIAKEHGADVELSDKDKESITDTTKRFAESILARQVIDEKVTDPTDEDLKALYEKNKDARFKKDEEMRMRHIFVSTYVPYEVKAGDTLESIAEEISGDKTVADRILANDQEKRPRAEQMEKGGEADEDKMVPRALVAGESLLVPIEGKKEEEAKKKIDEAYSALEEGGNFEDVAKQYSENENPGRLWIIRPKQQDRPIMEEITGTFMSLSDGTYSKPLRTKHGFQIIYRDKYQPEEYVPFEDAKAGLVRMAQNDQRRKLVDEFFTKAVADERIVKIHEDALNKTGDVGADSDVILTVTGKDYTRGDLKSFLKYPDAKDLPTNLDELRGAVNKIPAIQRQLVEGYAVASGLMDIPIVKEAEETLQNTIIANNWINKTAESEVASVSDDEIKKFYDDNPSNYKVPESYQLYAIVQNAHETSPDDEAAKKAAIDAVEAKLNGVESLAGFQQAATEMTPSFDSRFKGEGGEMGTVLGSRMDKDDLEAVRGVQAPGLTNVLFRNGEAIAYWVEKRQDESVKPLSEVSDSISQHLISSKRQEESRKLLEEYSEKSEVKLLVD